MSSSEEELEHCSEGHFMYREWFRLNGKLYFTWISDYCKTQVPDKMLHLFKQNGVYYVKCAGQ